MISLLLSDVIGDDLDVIGSGPTAPDASSFGSACAVIEKYGLGGKIPRAVRKRLERGAAGELEDTPKAAHPVFRRVQNLLVGSNALAVTAAAASRRIAATRMNFCRRRIMTLRRRLPRRVEDDQSRPLETGPHGRLRPIVFPSPSKDLVQRRPFELFRERMDLLRSDFQMERHNLPYTL